MLIYLLMIATIPLFNVVCDSSRNPRKMMCICCSSMLIIIAGLRDASVGTDTAGYINDYIMLSKSIDSVKNIDIAMKWLCFGLGHLGAPTYAFLMVCNALFIGGCSYTIYYLSKNISLSYYLLITLYYYFFSFNGMRQFMGIGLVMLALTLGLNKKYILMAIVAIVSFLFHRVSLIGIAILPIIFFKNNKWVIRLYVLAVLIVAINYKVVLSYILSTNEYYSTYYTNYVQRNGGIMSCVVYISCFILTSICFYIKRRNQHEIQLTDNILLLFSFIAAVGGVLQIFTFVAMRLFYFYDVFSIISIPNAIESLNQDFVNDGTTTLRNRKLVISVRRNMLPIYMVVIFITFAYMMYCFSFNWHQVLPYVFSSSMK